MQASLPRRFLVATLQVLGVLSLGGGAIYLMQGGVDAKWIAVGGLTLVYFGLVCYHTRDFWQNPKYWVAFLALVSLHVLAVGLLQGNRPALPGLYYGTIGAVEAIFVYAIILKLFYR